MFYVFQSFTRFVISKKNLLISRKKSQKCFTFNLTCRVTSQTPHFFSFPFTQQILMIFINSFHPREKQKRLILFSHSLLLSSRQITFNLIQFLSPRESWHWQKSRRKFFLVSSTEHRRLGNDIEKIKFQLWSDEKMLFYTVFQNILVSTEAWDWILNLLFKNKKMKFEGKARWSRRVEFSSRFLVFTLEFIQVT